MNKLGKYLRKKRDEADLSLREASKLAGVSHTHIMEIEDGKKAPTFDKVMMLLRSYHADVQDFLRETGFLPKLVEPAAIGTMKKIPVLDWVAAGKWSQSGDSFHTEEAIEWLESDIHPVRDETRSGAVLKKGISSKRGTEYSEGYTALSNGVKGSHLFALRVKGDSMEPEFNEGDIIIVSPTSKAVTGDYVVAKNDEEEATFKQFKRFDNTRILHPLNPKYPDIVLNKDIQYRIVGVVMEKKKRYK
jgi:SOS-response transcriptional repressor LexA